MTITGPTQQTRRRRIVVTAITLSVVLSVAPFVAPGSPASAMGVGPSRAAGVQGNAYSYSYNDDRQPTGGTLPSGVVATINYDGAGRPTSAAVDGATTTWAYAAGRVASITAPDGTVMSVGYDSGVPTSTTWSGTISGTVGVTFDDEGNLVTDL